MARGKATKADDLATLQMALVGYELERQKIEDRIKEIRALLGGRRTPLPSALPAGAAAPQPRKRNLSPAARKRIADSQKRRWAEHRKKTAQAKSATRKSSAKGEAKAAE